MTEQENVQPVFRALADPTRRAIISMLAHGERPIGEIASEFTMTRAAIAKHLSILREGGVIRVEKRGRERIHQLDRGSLRSAADWLRHFDQFWDERLAALKKAVEKKK